MNNYMQNTYNNYQKVQIETARKEKLVTMLMEAAIRFLVMAKSKTDEDVWNYRLNILKAEQMILELLASLNFEKGGNIAASLQQLYLYIIEKLSVILEVRKNEILEEVLNLLIPLRDTWNDAVKKHLEALGGEEKKLMTGSLRA